MKISKKNIFSNIIFLYLINLTYSFSDIFNNTSLKDFDEIAQKILGEGEMAQCCLSYEQYNKTVNKLQQDFPNLISSEEIGKTFNNNSIEVLKFKSHFRSNKAILFTGMHHAREPTSMMMNLYILLKLVHLDRIGGKEVREFLDSVNVYFLPIVNVDGYIINCDNYKKFHNIEKCMVRKNRRSTPTEIFEKCKQFENFDTNTIGVDLNRNYGYKFHYDEEGSSSNPCIDDYRGEYAFSEPETQAIKLFIENHPEIKIAFNYHAFGNLLIRPFNYAEPTESTLNLFMNYTLQKTIYEEFKNDGHFPDKFMFGNGKETINYKANGEASDWMLGEKHIVSFSPELGDSETISNEFYPSRDEVFDILKKNLNSALYAISRAGFYMQIINSKKSYIDCNLVKLFKHKYLEEDEEEKQEEKLCLSNLYQFTTHIQMHNNGFSDFRNDANFELMIDINYLKYLSVKLNTGRTPYKNFTLGNSNRLKIFEKYYNISKSDLPPNGIEKVNFSVNFIESFLSQIIEVKFYIDKLDLSKIDVLNKNIFEIRRIEDKDGINPTSYFNFNFNKPKYKIKLTDYEKFELNSTKIPEYINQYTGFIAYYKYLIISVLLGFVLIFIIILYKMRTHNATLQAPEEANNRRPNSEVPRNNTYLELTMNG